MIASLEEALKAKSTMANNQLDLKQQNEFYKQQNANLQVSCSDNLVCRDVFGIVLKCIYIVHQSERPSKPSYCTLANAQVLKVARIDELYIYIHLRY